MREGTGEAGLTRETAMPGGRGAMLRLYGLLGVMLMCWAANFTFAKLATRELPGLLVAGLRTVCAGLFMGPTYLLFRGNPTFAGRPWKRADVPGLLAIGVLGLVGNQIVFVLGVSRTSVAHSALLIALTPILVLLGAAALRHEKLGALKLCGMALAVSGVVVLQFGHAPRGTASLLGDGLTLLSSAMFAAFSVFGKPLAAELGILTVNAFAFLGGTALVLPYTLWELKHIAIAQVSLTSWLSVLYMGFFPSIVGYFIYVYALRRLPASRVSSVSYLQPICATLLAVMFLGERPGSAFLGGAALVLTGVWITQHGYGESHHKA
jgi:drug/metabolite transporter (DMT)-like permease